MSVLSMNKFDALQFRAAAQDAVREERAARVLANAGAVARRRAQRLAAARARGTHTEEEWLALVESFAGACARCGDRPVTKDHIVAISRGGSDSIDNLQPLCRSCNSLKGAD